MTGTFDEAWTELTPRLAAVLAARGVHAQDRDDILQDTALRLYRVWDSLAPDQPVWPYAVTITLNLWRDTLRHKVAQPADVASIRSADPAADLDVERTVMARQELATVGAALRKLAPEQRNLLLMNDEVAAVVRPLDASERMARMRVRRELAKVVGRASALIGPLWWRWRRPARSDGFAAAAYVGVFAATVMTGAQVATAAAPAAAPVVRPAVVATVSNPTTAVRALAPVHVLAVHRFAAHRAARPAHAAPVVVCPPTSPDGAPSAAPVISQAVDTVSEVEGMVSFVNTPAMQADSESGCVAVG